MAYTFRLKPNQEEIPNNEKEVDVYEHIEMEEAGAGTTVTVLEHKTTVTLISINERIALQESKAATHTAKATRLKAQKAALIDWWQNP